MWLLLPLILFIVPGSADSADVLTGPRGVRGPERGSLTVQCRYVPGQETYVKYWCRGADWSSCRALVRTTGSEQEVKKDRVSIRDNQTSCTFTVVIEELRREDTDTYWCGIERTGRDHRVPVWVTVVPAPVVSTTSRTFKSTTNMLNVPLNQDVASGAPTVTSHHLNGRSLLTNVHFLLLVFLKVPLFLSMLGAILWVNRPQRGPSGGGQPHPVNQ